MATTDSTPAMENPDVKKLFELIEKGNISNNVIYQQLKVLEALAPAPEMFIMWLRPHLL